MKMKSLLTAALLTSALMNNGAHAGLFSGVLAKSPKINSNNHKDVYSGIKFTYLDLEDRLMIVNDFLKTVEYEYAPLKLKEKRIGLDFKKIKADAIEAETREGSIVVAATDRKDEYGREKAASLQAISNMDFMDRMQLLAAKFKDTHFSIQERINRPLIYNGLRLFRVQGKIYVGSIETKLISMASKLSGASLDAIKVGAQVVSIDGVPVEDKIAELKPYISGSSEEYIDSEAVLSLTLRNFKYEKKNFVTYKFGDGSVYQLPIFANKALNATPRLDAITYFNKYGIPSDTATIGMTFDKASNKWTDGALAFQGYNTRKIAPLLKGMTEFVGADGAPAIRTGYYMKSGKMYGVMQLLTFASPTATANGDTIPFLLAIRNFVQELKENGAPLVLDLRVNGGGNGGYPGAVLSILAPTDSPMYPGNTIGFRMTHSMRQIYGAISYKDLMGEDQTLGATADEITNFMSETVENRLDYTPMFAQTPIPGDPVVQGFDNDIVALITPDCISACDMMSFLLKDSKRALMVGTQSNGTGAGFLGIAEINSQWGDPIKMFTARVPNFLFGRQGESPFYNVFGVNSVEEMCTENIPTTAHVKYSTTPLDVIKSNLGWYTVASGLLDEMAKVPTK